MFNQTPKIMNRFWTGFANTLKATMPHCLCNHLKSEHSQILVGMPCLATNPVKRRRWFRDDIVNVPCDCPGWMDAAEQVREMP